MVNATVSPLSSFRCSFSNMITSSNNYEADSFLTLEKLCFRNGQLVLFKLKVGTFFKLEMMRTGTKSEVLFSFFLQILKYTIFSFVLVERSYVYDGNISFHHIIMGTSSKRSEQWKEILGENIKL